jgi:hypothetical protein
MKETLKTLEEKRERILAEIGKTGDMRSGSIMVRFQRCGKSPCACDDKTHPGHGPIYCYSTKQGGKTVNRNFKLGEELAKIQEEVKNYQKYRELTKTLVDINHQICDLRPVRKIEQESEREALKKKLQRFFAKKSKGK